MAQVQLKELIEALKLHPKYQSDWEMGVPAEQALYIRFSDTSQSVRPEPVQTASNGSQIVVDKDKAGRVYGIEIV